MNPVTFDENEIRAILSGKKTQARWPMIPQPIYELYKGASYRIPLLRWKDCCWIEGRVGFPASGVKNYAPYKPGDVLYVREEWGNDLHHCFVSLGDYKHCAGCHFDWSDMCLPVRRSPDHMPREAARIFLRVTGMRVERVQGITPQDAKAEGADIINHTMRGGYGGDDSPFYCAEFAESWDKLYGGGPCGWDAQPWVWVCIFERISKEEAEGA